MLVTFGRVVRKITLRRIRASQCVVSFFRDLVARGHQLLHEVAAVVLVVNIGATMD